VAKELRNENTNAQKLHFKKQCLIIVCIFLSAASLAFIRFFNNYGVFLCSLIALSILMQVIVFKSDRHKECSSYASIPKFNWMKRALLICCPLFLILLAAAIILNTYILNTAYHANTDNSFYVYQQLGIYHFAFDCINAAVLLLLAFICTIATIVTVKTKAYAWMKYGLFISYFFFFVLFGGFIFSIINVFKNIEKIPDFDRFFLNDYIFNLLFALLIFSCIFLICYSIFSNFKVKWLLFLNTALFGMLTALYYSLGDVNFTLDISAYPIIVKSFYQSFGPVFITAVFFLLFLHIQKTIKVKRRVRYERADEKGNS
jgi:hypothetical protein